MFLTPRFLDVVSFCKISTGSCSHTAIVSGMKSRKLYTVDLVTGGTKILNLVRVGPFFRSTFSTG